MGTTFELTYQGVRDRNRSQSKFLKLAGLASDSRTWGPMLILLVLSVLP